MVSDEISLPGFKVPVVLCPVLRGCGRNGGRIGQRFVEHVSEGMIMVSELYPSREHMIASKVSTDSTGFVHVDLGAYQFPSSLH